MNSRRVHLRGQEHLPPFLKHFTDDTYQYSAHKHSVETTKDGILHTYSVVLSQYPLKGQKFELAMSESDSTAAFRKPEPGWFSEKGDEQLVSQIKSVTTSEMNRSPVAKSSARSSAVSSNASSAPVQRDDLYMNLSSMAASSGIISGPPINRAKVRPDGESQSSSAGSRSSTPDSTYSNLPAKPVKNCVRPMCEAEKTSKSARRSSRSSSRASTSIESYSSRSSLPKFTYSAASVRSTRSAKYVMMVHVKFLLLHRDVFHRRVQSMFTDEFPSDCLLEDVVYNFHQLCTRQLRNNDFNPCLSYCVGELNQANSKPVLVADMRKTLAQLANSNSVIKFALIVNNINEG